MKVMRLHAINDFRLEEIETPVPKGDEILVRIGACGIWVRYTESISAGYQSISGCNRA